MHTSDGVPVQGMLCQDSTPGPGSVIMGPWDHRFSNFAPCTVRDDLGYWYPTVEHAYQASKTLNEHERRFIADLPKPGAAKRAGQQLTIRPDWEAVKLHVMYRLLCQKFNPTGLTPQYAANLLQTGTQFLAEVNHWHDQYWGTCVCAQHVAEPGANWLGHLLMLRRSELAYLQAAGV